MNSFPRVQLRRVAIIVNGGTPTADSVNWNGDVPWATPVDLGKVDGGSIEQTERGLTEIGVSTGSVKVPAGCVLLSSRAPIGYLAVNRVPMAFNQGCKAIVPRDVGTDPRFLRYALESVKHELHARGRGSTFVELNATELAEILVPCPLAEEQRQIADYLDHETAEIDALIAEQEEFVLLLAERMRSFVEFQFIEHTERWIPLKRALIQALTGPFGTQLSAAEYVFRGVPVINPTHIAGGEIIPDEDVTVTKAKAAELARFRFESGDVVLGRKGEVDKSALVEESSAGFVCGSDSMALRASDDIEPRYLWWFLQSSLAHRQLEYWSVGSTVTGLNQRTIAEVVIPIASRAVQRRVVASLRTEANEVEAAISDADRMVALSRERRSALISAAVTGKFDVTSKEAVA